MLLLLFMLSLYGHPIFMDLTFISDGPITPTLWKQTPNQATVFSHSQILGPGCPLELAHEPSDQGPVALHPGEALLAEPEHVLVDTLLQEATGGQGLEP